MKLFEMLMMTSIIIGSKKWLVILIMTGIHCLCDWPHCPSLCVYLAMYCDWLLQAASMAGVSSNDNGPILLPKLTINGIGQLLVKKY